MPTDSLIASSDYIVVAGLGATGLSCLRYLRRIGRRCVAVDSRYTPPGLASAREEWPDLPLYCGDVPSSILACASTVLVSPGLALSDPLLAPARDAGVPLSSDIEWFLSAAQAPVVGITGSNGKSTVTSLVAAMAARAGRRVAVGGNLGVPALDLLDVDCELYVLELSSFQLERLAKPGLAVAAMLNLSADHIDRHGSMAEYHRAKQRIFLGCRAAVCNRDDALTQPLLPPDVPLLRFGLDAPDLQDFGLCETAEGTALCRGHEALVAVRDVPLAGRHGWSNALAALAIGAAAGLELAPMLQALASFESLPHRCVAVAELDGVRYVDDSKATNPGASAAALAGLGGDSNVVLLAGGQGKGADFSAWVPLVERHCKAVLLFGEDAPLLETLLAPVVPVQRCLSLQEAVHHAQRLAQPGDLVLLSPACASLDMFDNYADRGRQFAAAVQALAAVRA
jgi:UDP-N-acetylmuramoylalanine--D-glutamate ligase